MLEPWLQWKREIDALKHFQIPRCYKFMKSTNDVIKSTQLHTFCDGSEIAYGAVAYLWFEYMSGKVDSSVVTSKSRLTPLNRSSLRTIPRIELNSAKLAVAVYERVSEELKIKINCFYFWTDSMSTLQYINNEKKQLQRFVANRVAYIRDKTDVKDWNFVPGKINPADMLSRGVSNVQKFINDSTWINGQWSHFPKRRSQDLASFYLKHCSTK